MYTLELIDVANTTYTRPLNSNKTEATVNKHVKAEPVETVEGALEAITDLEKLRGTRIEYVLRDKGGNNVNHLIEDLTSLYREF